ncbi:MAG: hypothetical protein J0L77_05185 [Alphaproteobacteria bacterium]|nr:hypothetical protein [Alphaproteobacteria bacterium]
MSLFSKHSSAGGLAVSFAFGAIGADAVKGRTCSLFSQFNSKRAPGVVPSAPAPASRLG